MFESECNFKSQIEYFDYVMNKVPVDCGVIVTGHFADISVIKDYVCKNLQKYPNAIIIDKLFKYPPQTSLYVLPYVDAMVNVCSSLVLKALLCDVKIFSLGKNYNIWCQDFDSLDDFWVKINSTTKDKNNILYWYLTRYDVNTAKFRHKGWLYNFLKKSYENRHNINFNYFDEIISIEEVIAYFRRVSFSKKLTSPHRNKIFFVEKNDTHRIFKILGVEIKVRRRWK